MPTAAILAALERGATILTGNQRAARALTRQYAQHQRAQGRTVWRSPEILPWAAWTRSLWQQLLVDGHESRLLLSPLQETELWRSIIAQDDRLATLQSSVSLAPLAQRAHTLLHRHRARRNLEFHHLNADQQAFLRWLHAFERTCQQDGLLSAAALEPALAQHSQRLRLAPEYLLHGFDGLTPSQQDLLDTLRPLATFSETAPPALATHAELLAANSPEEEVLYLAQQVRDFHQAQPEAQIAVIVPDVEAQRFAIERSFRNTIAPWLNRIGNQQPAPFEFTLGTPLALQPAIVDALRLIRWTGQALPLDEVSSLVRSPFLLGAEHEFLSRAEFDARDLHDQPLVEPALTAQQVLTLLRSSRRADHLRQLATVLESIHRSSTRSRSFTAWTAHLRTLLEACGWPGERALDSAGFQLIERWNDLLDDLNALDFASGTFSFRHMLSTLQQAAHSTLFSLRSNNAPIQIMGALESAGSTFDAVFFLNASSSAWPAPASAHPLLPFALQRITSMPGADASADLTLAQRITSRILTSAPRITVTYAKQSSESEQLPSPLFAHLPTREVTPQAAPPPIALEAFDDSRPIPSPSGLLHGGSSILKNQAACAFRAFAEHRLNAGGLQEDDAGLTNRSRGNLAHQALEDFWHTIKTQAQLKELTQTELDTQIDASIQAAFARIQADPSPWNNAYLCIQQERLHQLLHSWLEMEKQRAPFEVAALEEERKAVDFGPLQLNLRVDRIDRVSEGLVLIDYKTGNAHPKSWLGDRPDEPQLPLYASLPADEPIAAIAFATLRSSSKERRLTGFEAEKGILPSHPRSQPDEPFRQTLANWKSTLLQLAQDFYAGQSQVNPKNYPKTCEHCDQRLLCRLNPALLDSADDDSEEESDE